MNLSRMARLATSLWFPPVVTTALLVFGLAWQGSAIGGFLLIYGGLVAFDWVIWMEAAWSAPLFYEQHEPEPDPLRVANEGYDARAFAIRLTAYAGASAIFLLALDLQHALIWTVILLVLGAYYVFLVFNFRRSLMDYMRRRGAVLKKRNMVQEPRFDTRNPEDRH